MFVTTGLRLLITITLGAAFAALLVLSAFSSTADANHSWNTYHWGRTSNPFPLTLGNNVSGPWSAHLSTASTDWNKASTVLKTTIDSGASNPKRCNPTSGRVEVCNSKYGSNGWLGLASIWTSGGHIVQGTAKMNDTYFNTATYNTPAWRNLVMCQEIGHTLGLAHVNETYNTANEGTCMDYTNNPAGPLSNEHPNQHDYDQLGSIYSHAGETNTYGSTSAASRLPAAARDIDPSDPAQRGQLIHRSARGGVEIYERDFGQGNRVITRVIRVIDGTPALDTNGGRGGGGHNHDDHNH